MPSLLAAVTDLSPADEENWFSDDSPVNPPIEDQV